jgi:hypothetical protein
MGLVTKEVAKAINAENMGFSDFLRLAFNEDFKNI